ncbi:NADH-quinone oxidoreductase subunit L [Kangiella sp. TOML190]|uniref:NADH-quinone oxidoreductase subunit L n=1 Tax=Kangiella sp. TOML190 TaxID=2931351 RepID=UPI00203BD0E2|nr:NADH-quinone oxidoreductase subunit L [Kangiella sp. TOML190]
MTIFNQLVIITFAPLIGAILAGLFGKKLGKTWSHRLTIGLVAVSFVLSLKVFLSYFYGDAEPLNQTLYEWASFGQLSIQIGFLSDSLSAVMLLVVTFVSLMVHVYSIGYMHDDEGYQRFFSYISLFTFSMLMLVLSNNFLQLFFGWEAVGVVSYLLIGFWFKKETAIFANMKAFLVNRVGDFGFLLGIGGVLYLFGSLDYAPVFDKMEQAKAIHDSVAAPEVSALAAVGLEKTFAAWGSVQWSAISFICICLFIGAMGKSAQVPLHVWLPDSMEGPTPISALIHAATMVTAGVFMVARMSPLFEFSETALAMVTIIGAITALFMGLVGIVQNDIKRIVAYSTLSQLGYMVVALGVSAYSAAVFHLFTHAFFKALLFLAAGSVIVAMHHQQDIRKMGGIKKYMPITYWTSVIGTLALIGTPFFAGFYSKDAIISAVAEADGWGSGFAYFAVMAGVVVTALYSIRMLILVFHGQPRMDQETQSHLHESPKVITYPLILLAIPSLTIGWVSAESMLVGDYFDDAIMVLSEHDSMAHLREIFGNAWIFALHGFVTPVFWLLLIGAATAYLVFALKPQIAELLSKVLLPVRKILQNKYYFDEFNQKFFAQGSLRLGNFLWRYGDKAVIDEGLVNGSARGVAKLAAKARKLQTGYLYHYALLMLVGLVGFIGYIFLRQ